MKNYTEELLVILMELIPEEPCRYDHHGNCQEHGWFGLDGEKCPVEKARRLIEAAEMEKHMHMSHRKTSWDLKSLLAMTQEERDKILSEAASKADSVYSGLGPTKA